MTAKTSASIGSPLRRNSVDADAEATGHDGRIARFVARRQHAAAHLADSIPEVLGAAGFECTALDTRRLSVIGRLMFFSAARPV